MAEQFSNLYATETDDDESMRLQFLINGWMNHDEYDEDDSSSSNSNSSSGKSDNDNTDESAVSASC
jgi:hypothetical protein